MSVSITAQVQCDKCHNHASAAAVSFKKPQIREARALAKADGWKLGKTRDLCKHCAAEIASQIKQLQSGQA